VVINEESNVLKEERTNSETLPVNHIPSYVGLSCAVSGYRSINNIKLKSLMVPNLDKEK
ncbi:hypothetical protein Avbf_00104, partial [Armadillidium vulgare]